MNLVEKLDDFLKKTKDGREVKRILAAKLAIQGKCHKEIENLLIEVKNQVKQIIDINESNVAKTNVVINDLPKIIFDLQRELFERKQFNKIKQQ